MLHWALHWALCWSLYCSIPGAVLLLFLSQSAPVSGTAHTSHLTSHHMFTIKQRKCFRLTTFVYMTVMLMMVVYVLLSVAGVLTFLLTSHPGQLGVICLGGLLVVCLLGLVSSLLLVMGLVTKQTKLFLPWLLYHSALTCLCLLGGLYQSGHFLLTDTLLSCLAIIPIVIAIFLLFFCLFVCQLYRELRASQRGQKQTGDLGGGREEGALEGGEGGGRGYRCVRSVRSLKRRSQLRRSRSVDSVARRDLGQPLVRVSSDPHLTIPRASLTRSLTRSPTRSPTRSDLNNNRPGLVVMEKNSSRSVRRPGDIMTKDQIIDMFACPDSQGF